MADSADEQTDAEIVRLAQDLIDKLLSILNLSKEDDWSFVIKSHACLETFVTEMLVAVLKEDRLDRFVHRIPLSDSTVGKLALIKDLGLLDKNCRQFTRLFSELRNSLVHRIDNFGFTFAPHFAGLNQDQVQNWKDAVGGTLREGSRKEWQERLLSEPRRTISTALYCLINTCAFITFKAKMKDHGNLTLHRILTMFAQVRERLPSRVEAENKEPEP